MSQSVHVLIVEDEKKIAELLRDFAIADGMQTTLVDHGLNVVETVKSVNPDIILLDVMLPGKDGFTLCKEIREFSDIPIIFLTARIDEIDRLMGLGFGADDYVCKPFSGREVMARITTILRRFNASTASSQSLLVYKCIKLDAERFQCFIDNQPTELTPVEFRLLNAMTKKPGIVFTREQLMQHCYQDSRIVSQRTIDSHMKNLRRKIQEVVGDNSPLQAVYGVGYKID